MSGHLSIGDRWRIISLSLDQGMTTNQIASVINCTSRTVRNILQLFRETNNVIEREERGHVLDDIHHLPYVIKIDVCAHHCPEPDGIQWMTDYPKVSKCDDPRPWVPSVFKWALETPNNQQQNHESLPQVQAFVDALEQLLDEPHVGIQERQRTDTSPDNGIEPDESR
ncbi:unnamed protein product [Rotaria sp. Silwood1]|nr:unnamed protein product [Rotaria sp. Silwood1]